jgi:hypothetical protein
MIGQDSTVVQSAEAVPPLQRRRRWKLWVGLAAVLVLLAGGAITAVAVSFHYLHAPALRAYSTAGWLAPDHVKFVQVGPYDGLVVSARPGHSQTFYIDVENPSSVTQTILGLPYNNNPRLVAEPDHLTISAVDTARSGQASKFLPPPVAIPPHGVRIIRLTHDTSDCPSWGPGRGESWTELQLKVRVGAFTRIETVDLADHVFELRGTAKTC